MSAITRAPRHQARAIKGHGLEVGGGAIRGFEMGPVESDTGFFVDEVGTEAGGEGALDEENVGAGGAVGGRGDLAVRGVEDAGCVDDFACVVMSIGQGSKRGERGGGRVTYHCF